MTLRIAKENPAGQAHALRRIRIAESVDEAGGKQVWHSTGAGIDLLTRVDAEGRARFQELTIHKRMTTWDRDRGLRTFGERDRGRKAGRDLGSDLVLDPMPLPTTLEEARAALQAAPPDRYVQHLERIVEAALQAALDEGRDTVTEMPRLNAPVLARPAAAPRTLWARLRAFLGL